MVLMAVLGAVLIAMAVAAHMTEIGADASDLYKYTSERESNYQIARSAVEMGYALLKTDNNETDSLNEAWAAGALALEWEGKHVIIRIIDEESKFPLSNMQKNPDRCEYLQKALVRFFEKGGLKTGTEACDQFLDWVDSDSVRRSRGGERPDYTDIIVKDAPMDSLSELLRLPAWQSGPYYTNNRTQQIIESGTSSSISQGTVSSSSSSVSEANVSSDKAGASGYKLETPGAQVQGKGKEGNWEDWVSVRSSGKMNINTVSKEVLCCLDEAMTQTLAEEIDSKRRSTPFKKIDELRDLAGMNADLLFRMQDYLCTSSTCFSVDAEVLAAPGRVKLHTIAERKGGVIKVLYWEIQ